MPVLPLPHLFLTFQHTAPASSTPHTQDSNQWYMETCHQLWQWPHWHQDMDQAENSHWPKHQCLSHHRCQILCHTLILGMTSTSWRTCTKWLVLSWRKQLWVHQLWAFIFQNFDILNFELWMWQISHLL